MTHRTVVSEMGSESGGTYRLARVSGGAAYREGAGDGYVLTLAEVGGRPTVATAIGAAVGALCAGGLAVLLLPVRGAPDGLTPTRGELWPEALAIGGLLGAVLGGLAAYALAARAVRARVGHGGSGRERLRLEVIFGDQVIVDGVDAGPLQRIESHPASSIVLVITERETIRLMLASASDAGALASTLTRALDLAPEPGGK